VKKSIGPAIRPEKKLIETAIRPPKKYRKNADGIGGLTAEKIPKKRRPDRRSTVEKIQEKMPILYSTVQHCIVLYITIQS
jgi:hypothetical protein